MAEDAPQRPVAGDEVSTLLSFLDAHRRQLRRKCEDLTAEQLGTSLPPSTMTLGGLLKHLAVVESGWFSEDFAGRSLIPPFDTVDWDADVDWEWHTAHLDTPEELLALYDASIAESRAIVDEALRGPEGLDTLAVRPHPRGGHVSLRFVLVHMIEEYAQHNGHADLIRESVDGRVGW